MHFNKQRLINNKTIKKFYKMFQQNLVFISMVAYCVAAGYGGGSSGGYGGSSGGYGGSTGPINAAVISRRTVEVRPVPSQREQAQPQIIDVDGGDLPVVINFRSASSRLVVKQSHQPGSGDVQETRSEDQPHLLKHEVTRPIIQEVREVILPYRRVVQEIRPVEEQVKTIVSKDEGGSRGYGSNLGGVLGGGIGGGRYGGSSGGRSY